MLLLSSISCRIHFVYRNSPAKTQKAARLSYRAAMEKKNRKSDENISLQDVDILTGQSLVHAADGAELAAHGAGVAVVILGQAGVTDGLCGLGVEGTGELCVPVQHTAGVAHLVVDVPGVGDALGDVGGVGGDLGGHDALLDVVHIGQSQMLGGGDIAQESRTAHGCDSAADGSGDVVITGGNVGDDGAEDIEGRAHADGLLDLHVGGDLIQGHMARAFHHDLNIVRPSPLGQLAQTDQLFDLADVGGELKIMIIDALCRWLGHLYSALHCL